jgi:hypothetical protein
LALAVAASTGCGAGTGIVSFLPPGPQTTAPAGNLVIYVSNALGNRVDAYRLGTDGLLFGTPFSTIAADNPRKLAIVGDVLYVSTDTQVLSIALAADGSLPGLPTASTLPIIGADVHEIAVQGGTLYAAYTAEQLIRAFTLTAGGLVPDQSSSQGGGSSSDYRGIAIANGFLYSASRITGRIDTYLLAPGGAVGAVPEVQDPATLVGGADDLLERNGVLYVTNKFQRRIDAYGILPSGVLPEDSDSETQFEDIYEDLLIVGDMLYASAFGAGRIDTYPLDPVDGSLPDSGPAHSTEADVEAGSGGLTEKNGILYVAQARLDRIDAYALGANGFPSDFPISSTIDDDLDSVDHFPVDLEIYTLP